MGGGTRVMLGCWLAELARAKHHIPSGSTCKQYWAVHAVHMCGAVLIWVSGVTHLAGSRPALPHTFHG